MKKIILLIFVLLSWCVSAKTTPMDKMIRKDFEAYLINETMFTQSITYRKCKTFYNYEGLEIKEECQPQQTVSLQPYSDRNLGDSKRKLPENTWSTYRIDSISNNTITKNYLENENTSCQTDYLRNIILINDYDSNDIFCSLATESQ